MKKFIKILLLSVLMVLFFKVFQFGISIYREEIRTAPKESIVNILNGDQLILKASYKSSLHDFYICYVVKLNSTREGTYFYVEIESPSDYPSDPFETFHFITQTKQCLFYSLHDVPLIVYNGQIYCFYNVNLAMDAYDSYLHVFKEDDRVGVETALSELCQTYRLEYIKYMEPYSEILMHISETGFESMIKRWASGAITEEELAANQQEGYEKQDLMDWATQVIQNIN